MLDVLIQGGWVVDGTGNPARRADVAIEDDRIVEVGLLPVAVAIRTIDASGFVVTPGFIDAHSHSDWTLLSNPTAESAVRQGVTTEIVGNCGVAMAPVSDASIGTVAALVGSYAYTGTVGWRTHSQYLETVQAAGSSINYGFLAGHSAIRNAAGIEGPAVDEAGLRAMEAYVAEALDAGALGLSTGLELDAGKDAQEPEVLRLACVLRGTGGLYVSHIRNRDARLQAAMDEFMRLAEAAGGRGQVSHLNVRGNTGAEDGAWERAVGTIERARRGGLDVLTDTISMTRGIGLMTGILPAWVLADGLEAGVERLRDPAIRRKLRTSCDRYWRFIHRGEWHRVRLLSSTRSPQLNGHSFPEIAAIRGRDEWDCYFDLLAEAGEEMPKLVMYGELYSDEHLAEMVAHPLFMLAVDAMNSTLTGPLAQMTAQPLVYAGQITYLTHHVAERGTLRFEEAIRKMTSMPADHFGLRGRGHLRAGSFADVAILDVGHLRAPSTIERPLAYAEGVRDVLVNGRPVLQAGEHTGLRPGRVLRR